MTTHNYYKKAITWNQQLGTSPRPRLPQALTFRSHLPHRHYCRSDLMFVHPLKQEEETTDEQTPPPHDPIRRARPPRPFIHSAPLCCLHAPAHRVAPPLWMMEHLGGGGGSSRGVP